MFIILVSQDFAVGVTYTTLALAETAATVMGLREYQIVRVFTVGERVVFRESETGPEELGTIRENLDSKFYTVDLDNGIRIGVPRTELSSAPTDVLATPAKPTESGSPKEPAVTTLREALIETINEYAEYDHPCDSDEDDLSKAHGAVSIHVLRELLVRHS